MLDIAVNLMKHKCAESVIVKKIYKPFQKTLVNYGRLCMTGSVFWRARNFFIIKRIYRAL